MTSPLQIACMSSPLSPPETNGYSVREYLSQLPMSQPREKTLSENACVHELDQRKHSATSPNICAAVVTDDCCSARVNWGWDFSSVAGAFLRKRCIARFGISSLIGHFSTKVYGEIIMV
jgi:hypothetical protein